MVDKRSEDKYDVEDQAKDKAHGRSGFLPIICYPIQLSPSSSSFDGDHPSASSRRSSKGGRETPSVDDALAQLSRNPSLLRQLSSTSRSKRSNSSSVHHGSSSRPRTPTYQSRHDRALPAASFEGDPSQFNRSRFPARLTRRSQRPPLFAYDEGQNVQQMGCLKTTNKCIKFAIIVGVCIAVCCVLAVSAVFFASNAKKPVEQKMGVLFNDEPLDTDKDGISDGVEFQVGMNPYNPDTDFDGIRDADEVVTVMNAYYALNANAEGDNSKSGKTLAPTLAKSAKTLAPTLAKSAKTKAPSVGSKVGKTQAPTTENPSSSPTSSLSPSSSPTFSPTFSPTRSPSGRPSFLPTDIPSRSPSETPSDVPSTSPSDLPSSMPSESPSDIPSSSPTTSRSPSSVPSASPSVRPSSKPSVSPSSVPSTSPSVGPSNKPSESPSSVPSISPSVRPSIKPSESPSNVPSVTSQPSEVPSASPSVRPSNKPSELPSSVPSTTPSVRPSNKPSELPSSVPSISPSVRPSNKPSVSPSSVSSDRPSASSTNAPTRPESSSLVKRDSLPSTIYGRLSTDETSSCYLNGFLPLILDNDFAACSQYWSFTSAFGKVRGSSSCTGNPYAKNGNIASNMCLAMRDTPSCVVLEGVNNNEPVLVRTSIAWDWSAFVEPVAAPNSSKCAKILTDSSIDLVAAKASKGGAPGFGTGKIGTTGQCYDSSEHPVNPGVSTITSSVTFNINSTEYKCKVVEGGNVCKMWGYNNGYGSNFDSQYIPFSCPDIEGDTYEGYITLAINHFNLSPVTAGVGYAPNLVLHKV